jgi:PHD/YefM family antitoxin component YafN of YafNO toxin-antitoxin module
MTLRLSPELEEELRLAAVEDRRSVHQTVVLAVERFLAARETAEILADPDTLRALAEAHEAVRAGDVVHGVEELRQLMGHRDAS